MKCHNKSDSENYFAIKINKSKMKEKRKLFVIDFSGDYEVWLSTSKEELLK